MTDFANAFKRGQQAAADAQRARESIQGVIDAVAQQILEATDGKILIALHEHTIYKAAKSILEAISIQAALNRESEKIMYVSAKNQRVQASNFVRLAKWSQAEEGFPCKLTFGKTDLTCYDVTSLESAFAELLANPMIGDALGKLLNEAA